MKLNFALVLLSLYSVGASPVTYDFQETISKDLRGRVADSYVQLPENHHLRFDPTNPDQLPGDNPELQRLIDDLDEHELKFNHVLKSIKYKNEGKTEKLARTFDQAAHSRNQLRNERVNLPGLARHVSKDVAGGIWKHFAKVALAQVWKEKLKKHPLEERKLLDSINSYY